MSRTTNHELIAFERKMKRSKAAHLQRLANDVEAYKRWLLACGSGGAMRHQASRPRTVTLPKLSILEDE